MNIFAAVKKSFLSKLLVFTVVATLGIGPFVPVIVFAQDGAPELPAPSIVSSTYTLTEPFRTVTQNGITFSLSSSIVKREDTYSDSSKDNTPTHNLKRDSASGLQRTLDGHDTFTDAQFAAVKHALEQKGVQGITRDNFFGISTPKGTLYYTKDPDALVALATDGDRLLVPEKPLKKLSKFESNEVDAASTDTDTEAGWLNKVDEMYGRPAGTLIKGIRASDTSTQQRSNVLQEQQDLNRQISDYDRRIALAPAGSPQQTALIAERDALKNRAGQLQNIQTQQNLNANGNTIKVDQCKSIFSFFTIDCLSGLLAILFNIVLKLASYVLGVVGMLFDYSIELAVNSAEFVEALGIVNPIWSFIRDILNMTFIFILLWIAVNVILGRKGFALRKQVPTVVIVAILINFSLFAAKLMVDGSNLVTLQLYESAVSNSQTQEDREAGNPTAGISSMIVATIGLPQIYNFADIFTTDGLTRTINGCGGANLAIVSVSIFGSLFMVILSFALLLAAVLFFSRLFNIVYLFIMSPLWVWGHVMDTKVFKERRDKWWKTMRHVLEFPIRYMLHIFVGVFAFSVLFGLQDGVSFMQLFCVSQAATVQKNLVLILNFSLVILLLMRAIKYANEPGTFDSMKFGKKFSESMAKRFDKYQGNAVKATQGIATVPTRRVVTAVSHGISSAAGRVAEDADRAPWLRYLATRLSSATRDPKVFGKTQKQANKDFKEMLVGKAKENTVDSIKKAEESIGDAPKWKPGETAAEYEKRAKEYAMRVARVYLKDRIIGDVQNDGKNETNEEKLQAAIKSGLKPKYDSMGNIIGYDFNQSTFRDQIVNIRRAHAPGNAAGNSVHDRFTWLRQARVEARASGIDSEARQRVTSGGSRYQANTNSIDSLKAQLKKHQEEIDKHPITLDQLNIRLASDPDSLKGVAHVSNITAAEKENKILEDKIKNIPDPMRGTSPYTAAQVEAFKAAKAKNDEKIKTLKEKIMANRENLQKKINSTEENIKKKEEAEKNKAK